MLKRNSNEISGVYHICNKSIANYGIFKHPHEAKRLIYTLDYYNNSIRQIRLSIALEKKRYKYENLLFPKVDSPLKFLAYCIMTDHYHILVRSPRSILSKYISDVENSFTRYFNNKFNRKGPLWQSRFRIIRIKTNVQLLHVSRYIHLNPTTANLTSKPEDWKFSSYNDYIKNEQFLTSFFTEIVIAKAAIYKKFCEDQIDYQRKLNKIKKLLLE